MNIEEYRKKLIQAQGSGGSSASSGISGYREALSNSTREAGLTNVYKEINLGYSSVCSGLQAQDAKATQSALAQVRRNLESLRHYGSILNDEQVFQDIERVQRDYQTMYLEYDGMKRAIERANNPLFVKQEQVPTVDMSGFVLPGMSQPGLSVGNVDPHQITMTSGAAKGLNMPEQSGELTEVERERFRGSGWLKNTAKAAVSGFAADYGQSAALGAEILQKASERSGLLEQAEVDLQTLVQQRDELAAVLGEDHSEVQKLDAAIQTQQEKIRTYSSEEAFRENQSEALAETKEWVNQRRVESETAMNEALKASEKLGTLGQWLTMGSVAAIQMLGDAALGGLTSSTVRGFGSGVKEGEDNGYDIAGQIGMGIKTAAITYFTEKAFGGNPLIDNDKLGVVGRLVQKIGGNKRLQLFMKSAPVGAAMEGLEEVLESAANWLVNKAVGAKTDDITIQSLVDDFVVGAMVGAGGHVVSAASNTVTTALDNKAVGKYLQSGGYADALLQDAAAMGLDTAGVDGPVALGSLYRTLQDKYLEQAIQERAMTLGEVPGRALGEAVLRTAREESLTGAQKKAYFKSSVAEQIVSEVKAALEGDVTGDNQWFTDAYIRPSDLGSSANETTTPETGTNAPESETSAPETEQFEDNGTKAPEGIDTEKDASVFQSAPVLERGTTPVGISNFGNLEEKGEVSNEGSSVLSEGMGRQLGESADVAGVGVESGTGADQTGSGAGQGTAVDAGGGSNGRVAAAKSLRIGLQSSVSQGIGNGTDSRSTLFLPVYGMNEQVDAFINADEELRAIQEDADKNGITVHFFGDTMELKGPGGDVFYANGYSDGDGEVWVCFNSGEETARQIYDHEKIHDAIAMDGGSGGELFNAMWAAVEENVPPEELRAISGRTMLRCRKAYDPKDIDKIHEEIICNAYAEMHDFQNEKSNEAVQAVRDVFRDRTGERPVQLGAKGTNGPPVLNIDRDTGFDGLESKYVGMKKESIASMADVKSPTLTPETTAGTAPNASISDDAENSNKEFDGIPLKSNYPGLTAYDRYITEQEGRISTADNQQRDFTDLRTQATDGNMENTEVPDARIERAVELVQQGKTQSQIFGETGLVVMMNGDVRDGFTGPVIWRDIYGRSEGSGQDASGIESRGKTEAEVSTDDGRGTGERFSGRDRRNPEKTRRKGWDELRVGEQVTARRIILEHADRYMTEEQQFLRERYGGDAAFAEKIYTTYQQGNIVLESMSSLIGNVESLIEELDALGYTESVDSRYSAAAERQQDFEGTRFGTSERRKNAEISEEQENLKARKAQVHEMIDRALEPVLEYSHAEEGTEDYIRALMKDPKSGKRPDRRVAERYAKRIGMPVVGGHRAIPFWSWIKTADRGNYGLVIGLGNGMGEVNVLFWNKQSGREYVRSMSAEELEIVPASHVDLNAEENAQSLLENEPEEVVRETDEEELPFTDEDFQRWAEEAERYTTMRREENLGLDEIAGRILGEEINTEEDSPLELDGVKSMLAENEEDLLLMEPDKAEKVYEFATQLAPGKGGNYNMDLSRNLDMVARNKGLELDEQRKLRETLRKEFEEPLWRAQDERSRQIKTRVNELHKKVVEGLGIKPGSRESAAVQWYGEGSKYGKYSGLPAGETKEYILDDLKRDFPKSWKNIVAAERYFRQIYDEYIIRHNQSLEKVYPRVEQRARERVEQYLAAEAYYNRRAEIQRNKIAAVKEKIRNGERARDAAKAGSEKRQNAEASIEYQQKRLELAERKAERFETRAKRIGTVCANLRNEIENGGILRGKRLNPRKDYFHHFQEMETGFAALKNIVTTPQDIDSKLSGVSENTKPKSKWAGYLQRRQGAILNADAVGGLVKYIPAAEYKITMDPVIARGRMQIKLIANATQKSRNANKFLTWYTDYINDLAGKTNPRDRWQQKEISRMALKIIKWLNSRVRSNAIMGNVRSAMSQFYNLPNATAYVKNPVDWFKGAWLCTENLFNWNMARQVMDRSGFLRDRYLDDVFSKFDQSVITVPKKLAGWMLTVGDKFSAQLMWCAAYEKGVRTKQKDPIQYADDITRRSTAGRGAGETPLKQTAEVTKFVAPFQVEVNNAWQLMKERVREKDVLGILNIWLTTFLMNLVLEALIGTRVGFDPIDVILDCIRDWDDEEPTGEQILNCLTRLGGELFSNVPGGTQIASFVVPDEADREEIFGESDPTRFGTGNIGLNMLLEPIVRWAAGDNYAPALLSAALNIGMPYAGKQTERVIEALQEYGLLPRISLKRGEGFESARQEGGGESYTDNGYLRFVEEGNLKNFIAAAAFGPFATKVGKAYINEDSKPLSGEKTELFQELTDMGASTTIAYMAVTGVGAVLPDKVKPDGTMVYGQNGYDESEAKDWETVSGSKEWNTIQFIESLDLEDEARELLYRELVASEGRLKDLDAMEEVMMTWPQKMEAVSKYLELSMNEDMTAVEKATAIKAWADMNFSTSQAAAIVENMTFSTGWTAVPESYDKLMDAGLSANDALNVTTAWSKLEPEAGKTQVSNLQKMNAIIETVSSPTEQMEALTSMLDDTGRWKLARAANYGVTAEDYVDFKNTLEDYYDYDPNGSVGSLSYDEVTAALQSMNWLSIGAKAVLWQIQTMGKDGKSNPFNTAIGWDVYNAYQDWKESGEEVEVKTNAVSNSAVEPSGWTGLYDGLKLPVW